MRRRTLVAFRRSFARAAIRIPAQFEEPQRPLELKPGELVDAFVKANPGLAPDAIMLDCDRTRLREIRLCLTRDLKFRSCGTSSGRGCRAGAVVLPPVRGP